jgi:uncharacterized membrane protein YfcA
VSDGWWIFLTLGAFVGFFSGLLGIGGGAAMVPVLALVLAARNLEVDNVVHLALGTSIATMLFTSASSMRSHQRHGAVRWRVFTGIAPGVLAGTFGGALLAGYLDARILSVAFTALIYYLATLMLIDRKPPSPREMPGMVSLSSVGGIIGVISSLTATGGSALVVPYLVRRGLTVHHAIGTAAAIGWPLALAGTIGFILSGLGRPDLPQWSVGFVYLPALGWIVIASMLMAPVGASIAHRTPGRTLKRVFAVVLYVLATNMLIRFF